MSRRNVYEWSIDGGKTFKRGFIEECAEDIRMSVSSVQAKASGKTPDDTYFIRKVGEVMPKPDPPAKSALKKEKLEGRDRIIAELVARYHIACEKEFIDIADTVTSIIATIKKECMSHGLGCEGCPLLADNWLNGTQCMFRQLACECAKAVPKDIDMEKVGMIDGK